MPTKTHINLARLKITFPSNCRVKKDTCSIPKLVDKFKDFHFSFCLLPQLVSVFCVKKASHINSHLIHLVLVTDLFTVFWLICRVFGFDTVIRQRMYFTWNWNSFPWGYWTLYDMLLGYIALENEPSFSATRIRINHFSHNCFFFERWNVECRIWWCWVTDQFVSHMKRDIPLFVQNLSLTQNDLKSDKTPQWYNTLIDVY